MRSSKETALLIALLLKRSGQKRARLSAETVKKLAKRKRLRYAFVDTVRPILDDMGYILIESDKGGFGIIPASALDGAPAITAKKYLTDVLSDLKSGALTFEEIETELEEDEGGYEAQEDL